MTFDIHFVQGNADVGLALANVEMGDEDDYGTASVTFPAQGQYTLRAVTGCPRTTVVGTSKQISAIGLNTASVPASTSASAPTSAATAATPSKTSVSNTSSPSTSLNTPTSTPPHTSDPSRPCPSSIPKTPRGLSKLAHNRNTPAIVGGIIGGLLLLALLALLFIMLSRRRRNAKRRLTFHKDMMVQPRRDMPSLRVPVPPISDSHASDDTEPPTSTSHGQENSLNHLDVEQGLASGKPRPLGSGHVVPSPKGPRPSTTTVSAKAFRAASATRTITTIITPRSPVSPAPLRTRRQKQLADRINMLQDQIDEVRAQQDAQRTSREAYGGIASDAGHGEAYGGIASEEGHGVGEGDRESREEERRRVLEDMQREMVWLRDHEQSAWAMGLTDVLPPGYARYMTP
ncbi:hypothetical protein GALMADRAFT_770401 [Galerina marginata CBS 339.88]|uniref:receptor protein-tyrosine kinase n=1 Tax=Galerina marginata (strain CBS 339.88) TaxID=685588 RepID=A0A067SXH7_GALM3|nr:hypothetical protein GALMADRAFT_770401 [Galerina marginata CBS 339.88]